MSFYITLPSNSSLNYFGGNTVTNYTTKLTKNVKLGGNYEVALVELVYPRTWFNVNDPSNALCIAGETGEYDVCELPVGQFDTPKDLLRFLKKYLKKLGTKNVNIDINPFTQRCTVYVGKGIHVMLKGTLAVQLGFTVNQVITSNTEASRVVDLSAGIKSLYVYCDLVEPQYVGDSLSPLLRIAKVEGSHGDLVSQSFNNPHYIPVGKRSFDTVEIDIRDDTGGKIPFQSGKSVITLHFRQKSPSFL